MNRKRKRFSQKSKQGFTLTEILIAITLTAVLLTGVTSATIFIVKSSYNLAAHSAQSQKIRRAINYISEDIRMANAITVNDSQTMEVVRVDGSSYKYSIRTVESVREMIRTDLDTSNVVVIFDHVSNFAFSDPSGSLSVIQVDADIEQKVYGGINAKESVSVRFAKRNS